MLLLEGYTYIFQILRALATLCSTYVEFSVFYVNQPLAGQTIPRLKLDFYYSRLNIANCYSKFI
jgi:hypothetical protein